MTGLKPEDLFHLARRLTQAKAPAAEEETEPQGWGPQTWSGLCREGLGQPD